LLTKPVSKDQLINAIERALARARAAQKEHDQIDELLKRVSGLTPRERQVFERVARGVLNKQIAHELGTTERTIKAHRRNVMEKIQAKSVAELVMVAERLGILRTAANREHAPHKGPRAN
jgi:FixJ family two-component response regulator